MKTRFTLLFFILLVPFTDFAQNAPASIQDVADHFLGLDTSRLNKAEDRKVALEFWGTLKYLRGYEQKQRELTGKAGFGFENNQTRTDKLFTLNAGIQIGRGIYPGEFTFNSKVDMTVRNGKFQENVSDIFLSYDYFPLKKDNALWLENFVFLNRFKDEFIGIEQRYEVGGGVIFEFWDKKHLTEEGRKEKDKTVSSNFNKGFLDREWGLCMNTVCEQAKLKGPDINDINLLDKVQRRTQAAIITQHTRFRAGMLMGLYMESEQGTVKDSVQLAGTSGLMYFERDPLSTIKMRWEARPTFVIRSKKNLEINFRPYFKFPMPWAWYETVKSDSAGVFSKRFDFHLDARLEAKITLTDDFQNKKVSIGIEHRVLYDHSPPRAYLNDQLDADGRPALISARNTHQITRLKFEVEF